MASQNSSCPQPDAFGRAVQPDRVNRVLRTGRGKSAAGRKKEWRNTGLVQTNEKDKEIDQGFPEHALFAGFPQEEFGQFPGCFLIVGRRCIFFDHDDDVMPRWKQFLVAAEEFPKKSFHSVAKNGVARFLRDGDSQAFGALRVAAGYDGKESRTSSDPLFVNGPITALAGYPFRSSKRLRFHCGRNPTSLRGVPYRN